MFSWPPAAPLAVRVMPVCRRACIVVGENCWPAGADKRHTLCMAPEHLPWPAPPVLRGEVNIEPLTRELVELDTVAYTTSPYAIRRHSAGRWTTDGFTMAENLALIASHETEHQAGVAFAYSLLSVSRDREVGCAYLRPLTAFQQRTRTRLIDLPRGLSNAAIATFWLIDDAQGRPEAVTVVRELESWIAAWGGAPAIFRCLPEETESIEALQQRGLIAVEAVDQELPYRWFLRA